MRCTVCRRDYNARRRLPLILPSCGHTFCRLCLLELEEEKGRFRCPSCDKVHTRPSVRNLEVNEDYLDDEDSDDDCKGVVSYRGPASQARGAGGGGFRIGGGVNLDFGVNEGGLGLGVNVTGGVAVDDFKVVGSAGLGIQAGLSGAMVHGQAGLAVGLGQDAYTGNVSGHLGMNPLPRAGLNYTYGCIPGGGRSIRF